MRDAWLACGQAVQAALGARGFRKLVVQRGKSDTSPAQRAEVAVEVYDFKPSLAPDMQAAALIISHAGAGCIMESLRCVFAWGALRGKAL